MITPLEKQFDSRDSLINYVRKLSPWAEGEHSIIEGGEQIALKKLEIVDPIQYAKTRNYGDGKITYLSPYIQHGILSLNQLRNHALGKVNQPVQIIKFLQELGWRDFWQRMMAMHPEWAWQDIEAYKTGYQSQDYADTLPDDITRGQTGIACIDEFINELITTGYLHNHARMYIASYVVHFRRIKWQAGAKWFLKHLLDGNIASNNLSWQWIASTFSNKPYIFNLENVDKYFGNQVDTAVQNNLLLDASYEDLQKRLFPNIVRAL